MKELTELEEDKVLSISTGSQEKAEHLRWLFYDYFHITATSSSFKIIVFNNLLIVGKKKPTLSNLTTITKERGIVKELDSLVQELIASPTPRILISLFALDESISPTALSIVLAEYGRVMGE